MNKTFKKILAIGLTCAMTLSLAACNQDGGTPSDTNGGSDGTQGGIDAPLAEATAPPIDPNAPTGNLVYLTYETTFASASEVALAKFEAQYGGTIETKLCGSGNDYFVQLGVLVTSGSSPDLVRYEWRSFPHGMSYNIYTPLDDYIDINSDLWKDMKDVADQFMYNGKRYYFPYQTKTNFAINYNALVLQEANLTDPMDLLKEDKWNWDTFEQMLKDWCNKDPNHIGYNGVGGQSFVLTTGKKTIDVTSDGIINNLKDSDIARCMQWLEKLHKEGLTGVTDAQHEATGHDNGYESPQAAFVDGNLLFLGMDPSWTYGAAKEELDKQGIDNDMRFVPFPKDINSPNGTYYCGIDTFGYLIPSGAPNVKGAIDWINFLRTEEVDPENVAKAKADAIDDSPVYKTVCGNKECNDESDSKNKKNQHIYTDEEKDVLECPSCGTPREEKYKVVWDSDVYDLWMEMKSTTGRFTMLFDNGYGFNDDVGKILREGETPLVDGPVFGDFSFTQLVEASYDALDQYLNEYRELMKQNAAGNLATMPVEVTTVAEAGGTEAAPEDTEAETSAEG